MKSTIIGVNANIPRAKLLEYHQEFQNYKNLGVGLLLRKRIQEFYDANGTRINSVLELRQKTVKEFYEHDDAGVIIQRQVIDNEVPQVDKEGKPIMMPVLREGKTDLEFQQTMQA